LARAEESAKKALAESRQFVLEDPRWIDLRPPVVSWTEYQRAIEERSAQVAKHRASLSRLYAELLPKEIQLPSRFQGWRFNIMVPEPERLVERIFQGGLFASRHYPSIGGTFSSGRFPNAERVHRSIVNLFNDLHYTVEQGERTCAIVARHLDELHWRPGD
jgi:hypothetical protein